MTIKPVVGIQEWADKFLREKGITKEQLKKGVKLQVPCTDGKTHEFVFRTIEIKGFIRVP